MPQPVRGLYPGSFALVFMVFPIAALKGPTWLILLILAAAGLAIFVCGFCIFRDINGAATAWSRMYKESKGIPPEGFTVADVPTLKFVGFMYMVIGVFFLVATASGGFS